jgi:hypothetical protein
MRGGFPLASHPARTWSRILKAWLIVSSSHWLNWNNSPRRSTQLALAEAQKSTDDAVSEGDDPLGEFHQAEQALDAAIELLREEINEKTT